MALSTISLGGNPNDGTGDTLRAAGEKINIAFAMIDTLAPVVRGSGILRAPTAWYTPAVGVLSPASSSFGNGVFAQFFINGTEFNLGLIDAAQDPQWDPGSVAGGIVVGGFDSGSGNGWAWDSANIASVVSALNGDTTFSGLATASIDGNGGLLITTDTVGAGSAIIAGTGANIYGYTAGADPVGSVTEVELLPAGAGTNLLITSMGIGAGSLPLGVDCELAYKLGSTYTTIATIPGGTAANQWSPVSPAGLDPFLSGIPGASIVARITGDANAESYVGQSLTLWAIASAT